MTRFDLDKLPNCGAKTRSGNSCKRKGTKKNGRCKLHGGRSTGAKTDFGKVVVARNAHKEFPHDVIDSTLSQDQVRKGLKAYQALVILMNAEPIEWKVVFNIVENAQLALEAMKYVIMKEESQEAFILIQAALDSYYQEMNHKHLSFHAYVPMIMPPKFFRQITAVKQKRISKWEKGYVFPWEKPLPRE